MNIKNKNIIWGLVLLTIILAGFYFRLKGLGKWPLAVDEYYLVKSSENIIKYGLPKWDLGGYYSRGLIQQYLTALLLLTGMKVEFASRIIPVIANVLEIPVLYIIGKKISGRLFASLIIFVFMFSVWEVEFARFARMYSLFQVFFVYYLYCLYNIILEKDERYWKWLFILSGISVFVYEGSIFLALLNFLPLVWNFDFRKLEFSKSIKYNFKKSRVIAAFLIIILCYLYNSFDFRTLGQTALLPVDFSHVINNESIIRSPLILFSYTFNSPLWFSLSILVATFNIFFLYKIFKNEHSFKYKIFISVMLLFSFLNLLGLAFYFLIMLLLINWIKPDDVKKIYKYFLLFISNLIFWTIFGILSVSWHSFFLHSEFTGSISSIKILWKEFINYPYFYETFVLFRNTLPKLTILILMLLGCGIFLSIFKKEKNQLIRVLFIIFLIILLLVDLLNLNYFDTRYFLFLYPLILILMFVSLERIINLIFNSLNMQKVLFVFLSTLILFFSEDFNLNHLVNIDSKEINYRINFPLVQKIHFYPRWDTRSPSEFINRNANDSDIVIINEQVNDFYLNKLDYIYRNYQGVEFPGESVDNGKKERWTDANLIYTNKQFIDLLKDNVHRKWLIVNTLWEKQTQEQNNFFRDFGKYAVYTNKDSSAIVYKIPGRN